MSEKNIEEKSINIRSEVLKKFVKELFIKVGMSEANAEVQTELLIWANLRGVDSQGVLHVPSYLNFGIKKIWDLTCPYKIIKETPAMVLIDANKSYGPPVTMTALKIIIEKARKVGIAWATLINNTHQGALGYYSEYAAQNGLIGISMVSGRPNMTVFGSRERGVSNAPLAIAIPSKNVDSPMLDMATSMVAGGKILFAREKGIRIPLGWLLDRNGNPTTDPEEFPSQGPLLPFGGAKGSGLAVMIECMTGVLSNNLRAVGSDWRERDSKLSEGFDERQNSSLMVLDVSHFSSLDDFQNNTDNLMNGIKSLKPSEGNDEVFYPGELEAKTFNERKEKGIPVPVATVNKLKALGSEMNIRSEI